MPDTTAVAPAVIDTMQGITLSFNSIEFRAKNIKVSRSVDVEDTSDTSIAAGSNRKKQPKPLQNGAVVTLEYWGKNPPNLLAVHDLLCPLVSQTAVKAICTQFDEGGAAGEFVTGNATFEVAE